MSNTIILVSLHNIHDCGDFSEKIRKSSIRHSLRKQRVSYIVGFIVVIHLSYISILWKICITRVISILFEDTSLPFFLRSSVLGLAPYDWMIMSLMDHDNLYERSLSSLPWIFEFCGNVLSRRKCECFLVLRTIIRNLIMALFGSLDEQFIASTLM